MNTKRLANILLRLGVGFAFLYPPFDALRNPDSWIGYFPKFMRGTMPDDILLLLFGMLEIALAVWIIFGKKIFWPALGAVGILLAIVFFNFNNFEILFRDISIAAMALALALSAL